MRRAHTALLFAVSISVFGCKDTEKPEEINDNEVITTVELSIEPSSGGSAIVARWADPEGDGSPVIDPITLDAGASYSVSVSFLNELEDPPEDITLEVDEESDEHQVFFSGDNVAYTYGDADANGFPVGLVGTLEATSAGEGTLNVTLRHLPPENGTPVKTGTLAEDAASGGIASLPGDTDASVDFPLTVQ